MTIDPFLFLRMLFWTLLGIGAFLYLRHVFFKWGIRDSKYPTVQHADKKVPPPPRPPQFLPGSYIDEDEDWDDTFEVESILGEGLNITKLEEAKHPPKSHPILGDLKDLRKAFLLDDILNRKWDK